MQIHQRRQEVKKPENIPITFVRTLLYGMFGISLFLGPEPYALAQDIDEEYAELVALFRDFREFQEPVVLDGVPDYTNGAMLRQREQLAGYQERLSAITVDDWPVEMKVDYLLVLGEMNGLDFYHRVTRPWSKDPVFYLMSQGGAGPAISGFSGLFDLDSLPMVPERVNAYRIMLRGIPQVLLQARANLTEAAGDLADIAVWARAPGSNDLRGDR